MANVIEDGSIVSGANAYVTAAEVRAYANFRGVVFDNTDTDLEMLIVNATDYIESKRDKYQGQKVSVFQSLQFPRTCMEIDGWAISYLTIPQLVKDIQCRLVMEIASGVTLMPTIKSGDAFVTEETVGPLTTKYAKGVDMPIIPAIDALLEPLFCKRPLFRTIRA